MTMATKTQKGILTSVTYGVYKSKLVGCPAETILFSKGVVVSLLKTVSI